MKNSLRRGLWLVAAVILFEPGVGGAATSAEQVKQETKEAAETAGQYAKEQQQELRVRMRRSLEKLDEEIKLLQQDIEHTSKEVSRTSQMQMDELKAKREKLSGQLQDLEKSSGAAWRKIRQGFDKAFSERESALKEAKTEFQKKKNEKAQ